MYNAKLLWHICFLLISTSIFSVVGRAWQPQTPAEMLAEGERLIKANCGECMGRRVTEFDRGVSLVEQSLREGVLDRRKALSLLVDAYSELTFALDQKRKSSDGNYRAKLRDAFEKLVKEDPNNDRVLMQYASFLEGEDLAKSLAIYEQVRRLRPDNCESAFRISALHIRQREFERGIDEFSKALNLKTVDAETIRRYSSRLERDLEVLGKSKEADRIRQLSAEVLKKLEGQHDED